jgi:hypothetical protein
MDIQTAVPADVSRSPTGEDYEVACQHRPVGFSFLFRVCQMHGRCYRFSEIATKDIFGVSDRLEQLGENDR